MKVAGRVCEKRKRTQIQLYNTNWRIGDKFKFKYYSNWRRGKKL